MSAEALIDVEIEDDSWLDALPDAASVMETGVRAALTAAGFAEEADVVVLLTDDAEMQRLNAEYRHKNKPTNVLSFPAPREMSIKGELEHLGDLALGFETCAREAREQGKSLRNHLLHLAVHGTLHLLGHDHEVDGEAEEMEAIERQILAGMGIADPYSDVTDVGDDHVV